MNASPYIRQKPKATSWSIEWGAILEYGLLSLIIAAAAGSFFKLGFAGPVWGLVYVGSLVFIVRDAERVLQGIWSNPLLLLFPVLCLVSVMWSIEPGPTLRHALQYLYTTLIAFWIGSRFTLPSLFATLAAVLLCCILVSLVGPQIGLFDGFKQDEYVGAVRYFTGLYTQKNIMGVVLVYAALATLVCGVVTDRRVWSLVIVLALAPIVIMTKSTTGLLMYLLACSFVGVLWFLKAGKLRLPFVISLVVVTLGVVFFAIASDANLVEQFLGALGKDTTLTGRTVIWGQGSELFWQHPWLGLGYQAFWESPAYANEVMLIRAAVLESIGGFHNGYLETAVAMGGVGLVAYCTMLLAALIAAGRGLAVATTPISLGAFYVIALIVLRTFTESAAFFQHDLEYILLIAVVVALGRSEPTPEASP